MTWTLAVEGYLEAFDTNTRLRQYSIAAGSVFLLDVLGGVSVIMNQLVTLQIVNWVGCGLSILVVLARIYARVFLVKKAGVDDVFMVMALVSEVTGFVESCMMC